MTVIPLSKIDTLKLVHFAYFHFIMSHGVIFWEIQQTEKEYLTSKRKPFK
jgi:hypothetical protein